MRQNVLWIKQVKVGEIENMSKGKNEICRPLLNSCMKKNVIFQHDNEPTHIWNGFG